MRIAIVTCDRFNEIDSFVTLHILNRVDAEEWKAEIASPSESVTSLNGVRITAQQPLEFANDADAVVFGSGRLTPKIVEDESIISRLDLDPRRQLIGAQCSGALILAKLGLVQALPVCTDLKTRPLVEAFYAKANIATAGGCLSAPYLATWVIWRLLGRKAAENALRYVAPVGDIASIPHVLDTVGRFATDEAQSAMSRP